MNIFKPITRYILHSDNASYMPIMQLVHDRYKLAGVGLVWRLLEHLSKYGGSYPMKEVLEWRCRSLSRTDIHSLIVSDDIPLFKLDDRGMISINDNLGEDRFFEIIYLDSEGYEISMNANLHMHAPAETSIPGPAGVSIPGPAGVSIPGPAGVSVPRPAGVSIPGPAGVSIPRPAGAPVPPGPLESEILKKENTKRKKKDIRKLSTAELRACAASDEERLFYDQMLNSYPRISQMTQPLTYPQMQRLLNEFKSPELLRTVMKDLENYACLHKKYVSAYLTLRRWIRIEKSNPNR